MTKVVAAVWSQDPFENEKSSSQRVYPNEEALTVLWKTQHKYNLFFNGSVCLEFKQKYSSAAHHCVMFWRQKLGKFSFKSPGNMQSELQFCPLTSPQLSIKTAFIY